MLSWKTQRETEREGRYLTNIASWCLCMKQRQSTVEYSLDSNTTQYRRTQWKHRPQNKDEVKQQHLTNKRTMVWNVQYHLLCKRTIRVLRVCEWGQGRKTIITLPLSPTQVLVPTLLTTGSQIMIYHLQTHSSGTHKLNHMHNFTNY